MNETLTKSIIFYELVNEESPPKKNHTIFYTKIKQNPNSIAQDSHKTDKKCKRTSRKELKHADKKNTKKRESKLPPFPLKNPPLPFHTHKTLNAHNTLRKASKCVGAKLSAHTHTDSAKHTHGAGLCKNTTKASKGERFVAECKGR